MKKGRRWNSNCAKTRQRHKKSFPDCKVLFKKIWGMNEMKRYPLEDKKTYEKRLNCKRVRRYRFRKDPEKQSRLVAVDTRLV